MMIHVPKQETQQSISPVTSIWIQNTIQFTDGDSLSMMMIREGDEDGGDDDDDDDDKEGLHLIPLHSTQTVW